MKMRFRCLAAIAALLVAAGPAAAQDDPAAALAAEVKAADAAGREPPRLSDPEAGRRIRAAFDLAAVSGLDEGEIGRWFEVCGPRLEGLLSYMLFDLDQIGIADGTPPEAAATRTVELMQRNGVRFQDEVSLGLRTQLRCQGAMDSVMTRVLETLPEADRTPARRDGAARVRAGAAQTLTGVVIMSVEVSTRPANRDIVLDEAVLQADDLARLMAPVDRRGVIAAIDQAMPQASEASVRDRLAKLRTALSRTDCGPVCAF